MILEHYRVAYLGELSNIFPNEIDTAPSLDWDFSQRLELTPLMEQLLMRVHTDEAGVSRFRCRGWGNLFWCLEDAWALVALGVYIPSVVKESMMRSLVGYEIAYVDPDDVVEGLGEEKAAQVPPRQ
ncbi:hypothetical protein L2E82_08947 [Cichorium intybus]|uniref:Uncharacterized protein n=1 Tax=Cichorium intybus TaxID=13427 RepID=A0ACB9G8C5_CICIN|nr:hypothetical protein L2E82_08947 [Cichorium intybus]